MLKNYFTVAIRNLLRYKIYAIINIAGLSIGLASGIIVLLFIQQQCEINAFHAKKDRIYKVVREERGDPKTTFSYGTSGALGPIMRETFPEVETTVRYFSSGVDVAFGERKNRFTRALVDPNFLQVFDFPLLSGERIALFKLPDSAVITDRMASLVFGDVDPLGKSFLVETRNAQDTYIVTGVLRDTRRKSTFGFDFLVTSSSAQDVQAVWNSWSLTQSWRPVETYVLLKEGQRATLLEARMQRLFEQYMGMEIAKKNAYHLQSLRRLYLHGYADFDKTRSSPMPRIYLLATIGLIVVIIACVNFINLATARATTRAREIGLRKVVGANRPQLIIQFMGESLMLVGIALIVALGLVEVAHPFIDEFTQLGIIVNLSTMIAVAPWILVLTLMIGVLSGCYPAVFLSAFQPVAALKSTYSRSEKGKLRKGLVIFQFSMSILLVICTLVVYQQLRFMETKNLGFNREHIVLVPVFRGSWERESNVSDRLSARYDTVKRAFLEHPDILSASALRYDIFGGGGRSRLVWPDEDRKREHYILINEIDESFFETFEIPLVAGRAFSSDISSDTSHAIILNEKAVRMFGWDDPLGKQIQSPEFQAKTVIGVIKDYHSRTLKEEISPMGFLARRYHFYSMALRIRPKNTEQTLAFIKQQWERFEPEKPFEYRFFDDVLQRVYFFERRTGKLFGLFSSIAIFVACLGLFGLAAFMTERRAREISVRKVLGASTSQLIVLLSLESLLLVLVANFIAWPIAYYLVTHWLAEFAYQINLGFLPFVLGAAMTLIIAIGTVSASILKAVRTNPVDALRHE